MECNAANEKGDSGAMYRALRKLETRNTKQNSGTTITSEQFKDHLQKVSAQRFENAPKDLMETVEQMPVNVDRIKMKRENEKLNELPSFEIEQCKSEIQNSAPGEDGIRSVFIKYAWSGTRNLIVKIVKKMFTTGAANWDAILKTGQIVPLHKKGCRSDVNNYRGICLLAMGSRIIAKIAANRLRGWSERLNLLDENQSGFRSNRSTADATQVLVRIHEDTRDLKSRRSRANLPTEKNTDPEARLLGLRKAYPGVNKPALWRILTNYGMHGPFLNTLIDLHDGTEYSIKGRVERPTWVPERGLREGCSTSPALFIIFHQVVMRLGEQKRYESAMEKYGNMGARWRWIPGGGIPDQNKSEKCNSEAETRNLSLILFADDTTIIGERREIEEGVNEKKAVMSQFKERNNDDKEEDVVFGNVDAGEIRVLGSWLGPASDLKNRKKRAGALWAKGWRMLKGATIPHM